MALTSRPTLRLAALLLGLPAGAALAGPPALTLPPEAVETAARSEAPASIDLPYAAFDGKTVPMRQAQGHLDQRAFRLDGSRLTTLALMQPLADQLVHDGWKVVFSCDTRACGGFDFRFAMDVLPEPDMHVDLGDFRYLLAEDGAGGLIGLLVSRSLDQGFVQITALSPGGAEPAAASQPQVEAQPPAVAASPDLPPVPEAPQVEGAMDLVATLEARGAVPLDDLAFASGKAELEAGDYASLSALVAWLAADATRRITLVGHTDATGSLEANVALSRARAQAVRARLVARGADPARIDAEGAGYLAPRASNQTPEGRQANRRVEVMVTSIAN